MKTFITLIGLLTSVLAQAAVVKLEVNSATSIKGLEVGGQLYDVAFHFDSFDDLNGVYGFPFLNDFGLLQEGTSAVVNELNAAGAVSITASNSGQTFSRFNMPITGGGSTWFAVWSSWNDWSVAGLDAHPLSSSTNAAYAVFTVTTVPVPSALWLFGSALAGMGWLRRKA